MYFHFFAAKQHHVALSLPCVVFVCCVRHIRSDMKKVDFYLQANCLASKTSANLHIFHKACKMPSIASFPNKSTSFQQDLIDYGYLSRFESIDG